MNAITTPFPPPAKITIEAGDHILSFMAPHGVTIEAEWTRDSGANYTLDFYAPEGEVVEAVQQPALFNLAEADCE